MPFSSGRVPLPGPLLQILQISFITLVMLGGPISGVAQSGSTIGTGGTHKIVGRIYFPSGRRSDGQAVKVTLDSTSSERIFVLADMNGSFVFSSLAPGSYSLTIEAGSEYEIARELVTIESLSVRTRNMSSAELARSNMPRNFNVMITLQPKRGSRLRAAVLDASLANVPGAARTAYESALEAIRLGNNTKAVDDLQRAIALYPNFTLAINDLGVRYLKLGQPQKAAEVLKSGVQFAPDDFHLRLNYGVALLNQKKYVEAEEQLRVAVSKNSSAATAHMYLGIALAVQRKLDEANKELQIAIGSKSVEIALAHRYLGGILLEKGEYKRAADELETYLRLQPKAVDSEVLQQKIKELRNKT